MSATLYVKNQGSRNHPLVRALERALDRQQALSYRPIKQLLPDSKDFDPAWFLPNAMHEAYTDAPPKALREVAWRLKRRIVILANTERQQNRDQMVVRVYAYDAYRNRTASRSKVTVSSKRPGRELEKAVSSLVPLLNLRPSRGSHRQRLDWYRWAMRSPYVKTVMKASAAFINTKYNPYYKVYIGARFRRTSDGGVRFMPYVRAY
jgi:hypothetical protein